jgi:hypothetical protein
MIRAYEEIVDFIAASNRLEAVVSFEPSEETKESVADLRAFRSPARPARTPGPTAAIRASAEPPGSSAGPAPESPNAQSGEIHATRGNEREEDRHERWLEQPGLPCRKHDARPGDHAEHAP